MERFHSNMASALPAPEQAAKDYDVLAGWKQDVSVLMHRPRYPFRMNGRFAPESDLRSGPLFDSSLHCDSRASHSDLLIDPSAEQDVWLRLADRMVV
jgi:hypothetical protein